MKHWTPAMKCKLGWAIMIVFWLSIFSVLPGYGAGVAGLPGAIMGIGADVAIVFICWIIGKAMGWISDETEEK